LWPGLFVGLKYCGPCAIETHSFDEREWYASYGALPLLDAPLSLLLPLSTVEAALKAAGK
jgi:hypothetical protein